MKSVSILDDKCTESHFKPVFVQIVWNIFPANAFTSSALLFSHLLLLWGIWALPAPFPLV